jgi:hypothetical protein
MKFEFNNDLPLTSGTIATAFETMRSSIDSSLMAINETMGDYMTADFMEKVQIFYGVVAREIESAENYYKLLEGEVFQTKKFLEFLKSFESEVARKIEEIKGLVIEDSDGSDYRLNRGFTVILAKSILDAQTVVLVDYTEKLTDLALLIETQEQILRERDGD